MVYLLRRSAYGLSSSVEVFLALSLTGLATIVTILAFFFRDPERLPPSGERIILSPADGTVLYIKKIQRGEFPFAIKGRNKISLKEFVEEDFFPGSGYQIGIGMNLLNVHVNRTPIKGKVVYSKKVQGGFSTLRNLDSLLKNERVITIFDRGEIRVGVVQIASRLVRRIVSYLKEGDEAEKGERMGMIRFGSQVDLLIPAKPGLQIEVREKEEVLAGLSVIASY